MWFAQLFIYIIYMFYGLFMYGYQGQYVVNPSYLGISKYSLQTAGNVFAMISALIAAGLYGNIGVKGTLPYPSVLSANIVYLVFLSALQQCLRRDLPRTSPHHQSRKILLGGHDPHLLVHRLHRRSRHPRLHRSHLSCRISVHSPVHLYIPPTPCYRIHGQEERYER